MRSILGPPIQPGALFYSITAGSPLGIPPKKKQLPVQSQRQSEHEQHLQGVEICNTDFLLTLVQFTIPRTINFSAQDSVNVNAQISKFLQKGIIVKSSLEEAEFVSNIFRRPQKDGSFRIILNLKDVNTFVFII